MILGKITLVVFFIALVLAFFFLTVKSKKHNKVRNRLMGFFLLSVLLHISVFYYSRYFVMPLFLEQIRDQLVLLFPPLLYLYLLSSLYLDFKLVKKHLAHLIPFILVLFLFVPRFFVVPETDKIAFYQSFHSHMEAKIYAAVVIISTTIYLLLMIRELENYKRVLDRDYSPKRSQNYKWLKQVTILLTLLFVFSFLRTLANFSGHMDSIDLARIVHTLLLLIFIIWLVLKHLYSPEISNPLDTKHLLDNDSNLIYYPNPIHGNTVKANNGIESEIVRLKQHLEKHKPFLSPSLTMKDLADDLQMQPHELSLLINRHLGKHFFDFINEYRIKMAITILENPERRSTHISEIIYEVGFNSKSSFNTAFKKITGTTPTDYRKSKIN
ncbi:AraC family transcriptional regulator [Flagellimonas lutimaris]|uniref:AraC family transcriptional regulator n=1 Tax=Flagellimonas lutimaris TaxID=475082 RepID=A0A3A1N6Z6_9FLAO|nr:AraC family transcriptional regulator [Allomuricauda lutimaris]RIV31561.1 AraC family transcriptional regulator [Allomuricauda lutimaris]